MSDRRHPGDAVVFVGGTVRTMDPSHPRGRIAPGLVADLVVLDDAGHGPRVAQTWRGGKLVHTAGGVTPGEG